MLDTIVYEVKYLYGHKSSLSGNNIYGNIFSYIDEEGNIFMLFDRIVDHSDDVTETNQQYAFVVSNH